MLNPGEKAYCAALLALKKKDYSAAMKHFEEAAPFFKENAEFNLLMETTKLLVVVKNERMRLENDDTIEIEEALPYG